MEDKKPEKTVKKMGFIIQKYFEKKRKFYNLDNLSSRESIDEQKDAIISISPNVYWPRLKPIFSKDENLTDNKKIDFDFNDVYKTIILELDKIIIRDSDRIALQTIAQQDHNSLDYTGFRTLSEKKYAFALIASLLFTPNKIYTDNRLELPKQYTNMLVHLGYFGDKTDL